MCGIVGFIDTRDSAEVASVRLAAMLADIVHRGPDAQGVLMRPESGFYGGMRRLSIIDVATGQQPIWNEDHTVAVLFNGEIYNYIELRSDLKQKGHVFHTDCDTEVLVHLYEEYRTEMCSYLRGMFAFVILDVRSNRLLIARDHFGQKPLYFCSNQGRFAFASEIKALFRLPWIPRESLRNAYFEYLSWSRIAAPRTHFRDIFKLPAGHQIEMNLIAPERSTTNCYWQFKFHPIQDLSQTEEAVNELDAALCQSVQLHLRSDVPVGVMLSGGLDSRLIAEFARLYYPSRLHTFSVAHDGPDSEGANARSSAEAMQTMHTEIFLKPQDLAESISGVAWHLDEPVGDPAAFAVMKLCLVAHDHVKVLLGGEGADELFGGYHARYRGIMQQIRRSNWLRRISGLLPFYQPMIGQRKYRRACDRAHMTPGEELIRLRTEGLPGYPLMQWGFDDNQIKGYVQQAQSLAEQLYCDQGDLLSTAQSLDVRWQLADGLLLKSDKMSMAASLELRCPFLDTRLADIASRIPPKLRLSKAGEGKIVLRECLRRRLGHLPVLPKRGFPIPLDSWIRGPLRSIIFDTVFDRNSQAVNQLSAPLLQRMWDQLIQGQPLGSIFYSLWLYEEWSKAFHGGLWHEKNQHSHPVLQR